MNLNEIVKNCGKCALCLAVCPVYKVERNEVVSPRAKVQLIKAYLNKELEPSKYSEKIFSSCLLCESCRSICPGGVKSDELFLTMRNEFIKKYGLRLDKKVLSKILSNKNLFFLPNLIKFSRGQDLAEKLSFINFNIGSINVKNIPKLSSKTLKSQFPEIVKAKGKKKGTLLYFTGCLDNFFYDSVGKSAINVLTKLGFDVVLSKEEMCCGIPMLISGDFESSVHNIRNNLKFLDNKNIDAIIVTCATCGTALKKLYVNALQKLKLETELDSAARISKKIKDINEFLAGEKGLKNLLSTVGIYKDKKVTYHDPCHLVHGQNIKEEPRNILKNINGIEFIEMEESDGCCGAGGFFQLNFPDISAKIGEKKLKNITDTKADIVTTSCPACKIQLINLVKGINSNTEVLQTVELINKLTDRS